MSEWEEASFPLDDGATLHLFYTPGDVVENYWCFVIVNQTQIARSWWTHPDHRGRGLTFLIADSLRERYPALSSPSAMPAWSHVANQTRGIPIGDPSAPRVVLTAEEGEAYAAQINESIRTLLAQR